MKKKVLVLGSLVVMFAFMATTALANYGEDNSLKGKVKDKTTMMGIYGAKVSLYNKKGTRKIDSDKTNKSGSYKIEDLTEATYKMKVSAVGYRNPKNASEKVSKTIKVDGKTTKRIYMVKA